MGIGFKIYIKIKILDRNENAILRATLNSNSHSS